MNWNTELNLPPGIEDPGEQLTWELDEVIDFDDHSLFAKVNWSNGRVQYVKEDMENIMLETEYEPKWVEGKMKKQDVEVALKQYLSNTLDYNPD